MKIKLLTPLLGTILCCYSFSITAQTTNTKLGINALAQNTTGTGNTAIGYVALEDNTTGSYNTATGDASLTFNRTGEGNSAFGYRSLFLNKTGNNNTANGYQTLYYDSIGNNNTAIGSNALFNNKTGSYNTATGYRALLNNTTGEYNTAYGVDALYSNISGINNTAIGIDALSNNATGHDNTATGLNTMYSNTTGYDNTATGKQALFYNTTGSKNTAIGHDALIANTTGSYNVAVGDSAGAKFNSTNSTFIGYKTAVTKNLTNVTVIGYLASATASNQVRIGNNAVTSIGGKVSWTTLSDGRFKKNIREDVPGLPFITKLRPVTYTLDIKGIDKANGVTEQTSAEEIKNKAAAIKEKHTGFIAQEVLQVAEKLNYDFSGVDKPKNDKDFYGLRYAEFVVPLVKAVQELSEMNEEKDAKIDGLQKQIDELKAMITGNTKTNVTLSDATLEQNVPNPFNNTTTIRYKISSSFKTALIKVTAVTGQEIQSFNISGKPQDEIVLSAAKLQSGTYFYTLYVDGQKVDSKKLLFAQ